MIVTDVFDTGVTLDHVLSSFPCPISFQAPERRCIEPFPTIGEAVDSPSNDEAQGAEKIDSFTLAPLPLSHNLKLFDTPCTKFEPQLAKSAFMKHQLPRARYVKWKPKVTCEQFLLRRDR